MQVVFVGAEKLPEELADAFEKRFGFGLMKATGRRNSLPSRPATSRRAVASVRFGRACRSGTVGRPLPGVMAKVVDFGDDGRSGIRARRVCSLIKGPTVMKGYLNQPNQTTEVIRDGWYVTGDIATIDADGFIRLTDRLSRFSKIAGEMVPHLRVEEAIAAVIGSGDGSAYRGYLHSGCQKRRAADRAAHRPG